MPADVPPSPLPMGVNSPYPSPPTMGFAPVRPHLPKLEQKLSEGLILSNAELKTLRKAAPLAAVRKLA